MIGIYLWKGTLIFFVGTFAGGNDALAQFCAVQTIACGSEGSFSTLAALCARLVCGCRDNGDLPRAWNSFCL